MRLLAIHDGFRKYSHCSTFNTHFSPVINSAIASEVLTLLDFQHERFYNIRLAMVGSTHTARLSTPDSPRRRVGAPARKYSHCSTFNPLHRQVLANPVIQSIRQCGRKLLGRTERAGESGTLPGSSIPPETEKPERSTPRSGSPPDFTCPTFTCSTSAGSLRTPMSVVRSWVRVWLRVRVSRLAVFPAIHGRRGGNSNRHHQHRHQTAEGYLLLNCFHGISL